MQEVKLLSERQDILKDMVEDKTWLQSGATEKYYEQLFEEMKELEGKKSEEALLLVQKKTTIDGDISMNEMKQEGCRDLEAREGRRRRARRTFSHWSHAGHRRWTTSKR